mgnify:CR=1 FL=1
MTHATQAGPAEDRARRFIEDSYIKIEHAFGADLAARCREELWMATGLSPDELTYAVQLFLSRIVFLRICEDRDIERYETLRGLTAGNSFDALMKELRRADAFYDSGLFRLLDDARARGCRVLEHGPHAPALVIDPQQSLSLMQEEIFGRALPVISVKHIDDAIRLINSRPRPLALYAFTHQEALQETQSRYQAAERKRKQEVLRAEKACKERDEAVQSLQRKSRLLKQHETTHKQEHQTHKTKTHTHTHKTIPPRKPDRFWLRWSLQGRSLPGPPTPRRALQRHKLKL